jgi:hypothetical protein
MVASCVRLILSAVVAFEEVWYGVWRRNSSPAVV